MKSYRGSQMFTLTVVALSIAVVSATLFGHFTSKKERDDYRRIIDTICAMTLEDYMDQGHLIMDATYHYHANRNAFCRDEK